MAARPRARPIERDLLEQLLADRDPMPFASPVVSWSDQDEDAYLAAIERCATASIHLARRGREHGDLAELDPALVPGGAARAPEIGTAAHLARSAERWHAARPVVLPGVAADDVAALAPLLAERHALHEQLTEPDGLAPWLASQAAALEPDFAVVARRAPCADPERDVARATLAAPLVPGARVQDLWVKAAWLSTHDEDRSLRLRVGFGRERQDDASRDLRRHRLVADLAERLLPESAAASGNPPLVQLVERLCGEAVLFTQHIAYWNAPGGGALFHHDAFGEDERDGGSWRQLGVCYVQLDGATAWLALSTDDLVDRIVEFADALEGGALSWVRAQLFEGGAPAVAGGWRRFRALIADRERLVRELAQPGCGALGALVDRGPEFTSFLADAGHAAVLRPGDAILLPNRGLARTCMHSVFCAGDDVAYGVSLALRPDREPPEARLEEEARRWQRIERARAARSESRLRRR